MNFFAIPAQLIYASVQKYQFKSMSIGLVNFFFVSRKHAYTDGPYFAFTNRAIESHTNRLNACVGSESYRQSSEFDLYKAFSTVA